MQRLRLFRLAATVVAAAMIAAAATAQDTAAGASLGAQTAEQTHRWIDQLVDHAGAAREFLAVQLPGGSVAQWLAFAVVLTLSTLLRRVVVQFLFRRLKQLASRTKSDLDDLILDALERPAIWFVLLLGLFASLAFLSLPVKLAAISGSLFQASTILVGFWGVLRLASVGVDVLGTYSTRHGMDLAHFVPLIKRVMNIFLVAIGAILVVQNLGYSVGSLLAGLGIGGLAVALAAQESLANLFGSITISADLPFKVGDWIKTSQTEGIVEEVGMRSTKVRTFNNTVVQIPNKAIASDSIENLSRRSRWRITQTLGLTYTTSRQQLGEILEDLRRAMREDPGVHPEVILANFDGFGPSSLDISVVYFANTTAGAQMREIRERMNLKFMEVVERHGAAFAYPTQTLHVATLPAGRA